MPPALLILIGICGGSVVLWLVTTMIVCYQLTFFMRERVEADLKLPSEPKHMDVSEQLFGMYHALQNMPYERVEILSRDGLRLSARYYHRADNAPLAICFHGYKSNPCRDCYGMAHIFLSEGYNLLLPDQRAHGKSQGHTICFGIRERFDCADWITYANYRFGIRTPIILGGVSMGAATVLMACGLRLTPNVFGVVADCPFSSPRGIINKVTRDMGLSPRLLYPCVALGAFLLGGGLRLKKRVSAIEAVKHARMPILLLHGEADDFVPCYMSRDIRASNPERVELHTFPQAAHTHSYISDPARYDRILRDFLRRQNLQGKQKTGSD